MENNITLNIHCETDSEFSKSLISALSICNDEVNRIQETLTIEKTAHGKALEDLEKEKTAHGKALEDLEKEKTAHGKALEDLEKEKTARGKALEDLEKEKTAHGKALEDLEKEKTAHGKTKHELSIYTSNLFKVITKQFDEISALLEKNINSYNNDKLQEYVLSIINQNKGGWSECNSIDDLLHNLKVGSGAICRVVNLIWWSKQESLQYMMSMVNHIDEIESKMKVVDGLLTVVGHTIKYPTNVLSNAIPNYISYDDEKSNFIDIFSSENYDNGILCEIRLLSIDDSEGKMYEYYK